MKYCKNCAVTVTGKSEKCPLCQNTLAGEPTDSHEIFPYIPIVRHKHSLLYRMLMFSSIASVIISITVNWLLPQSGFWSIFVVAGVLCVWTSLSIAIRKRNNILRNIIYQVTVIMLAALIWDIFTGWHGWSVDFVIPTLFVSAMLTTAVLAYVFKMNAGTYIIYLFVLILYGIIPLAFVLSGLAEIVYPSLICVAVSFLSLTALFTFEGKNMIEELKRRLHL